MRADRLPGALLAMVLALLAAGCGKVGDEPNQVTVHREKSMYRDINVIESGGYRCLSFGRRRYFQSCMLIDNPDLLATPYSRGMLAGWVANPGARRVLMIGLGGGVIPRAMRLVDPDIRIDVVELDPAVVQVARDYFGYREDAHLRTHIGDGRVFVRKQARAGVKYDIVMIDAFERVYVPEHMITREFIGEVASVLSPGGTVASNTFSRGPLAPYEAATYQAVFGDTQIVEMALGSRIILAGRNGLPDVDTLDANAKSFETRFQRIGIFLPELEPHPLPRADGHRPLTDQYSPANLLFEQ